MQLPHIKGHVHLTNPHSQYLRQKWLRVLLNIGGFNVGQGHVLEKKERFGVSHVSAKLRENAITIKKIIRLWI